jgi:uncharacterized protein (DUF2336 family)
MSKIDLQNIARTGSVADKGQLAETLSDLFLGQEHEASSRELDLFFDIVRRIIRDIEMHVRRKLSEQLASRPDAPHDLVVLLANDVIEVAFPVLGKSPVLRDEDLIDLVLQRATEYRQAIAGRNALPVAVTKSIVSTGDVSAISSLLRNESADLDPFTLSGLVDASKNEAEYQVLLISRHDLPETLANRLYDHVSGVLRDHISETFPGIGGAGVGSVLERDMSDAVERALAEDQRDGTPDLSILNRKTPDFPAALIDALEKEDILRFEDLFQQATDLGPTAATRAMYDMGPEGLAIACKAIAMDPLSFDKVFCRLRGQPPFADFRRTAQYIKAIAYFNDLDRKNARRTLDEWR